MRPRWTLTATFLLAGILGIGLLAVRGREAGTAVDLPVGATGLIVHVGTTDGKAEELLARSPGAVILGVAPGAKGEGQKAREYLSRKGLLGRVSILDCPDTRVAPLVSNSAALVIADLDRLARAAPTEKELLRIVRPLGELRLVQNGKWRSLKKGWPDEFDDWPQYFHDAGGADVSGDRAVGPVRGLAWHTGDTDTANKVGLRSRRGLIVSVENTFNGKVQRGSRLVCRDAFSGLKRWQRRDLSVSNRYALLLDEDHVYLHADETRHLIALSLATGKTVRTYDHGLDLSMDPKKRQVQLWPQVILHGGRLVQVAGGRVAVLEAATGKRLWGKNLAPMHAQYPTISGDNLLLARGREVVAAPAYLPGWNCVRVEEICAYDLASGKPGWRWKADISPTPSYLLHMGLGEGALALVTLDSAGKARGTHHLVVLDPKKGSTRWKRLASEGRRAGWGHGNNLRVLIQNGRVWCTALRSAVSYRLGDGGDPVKVDYLVSQCQPTRAAANYHFSALSALRLSDNKVLRSEASRSACDIGAFPSNGLLYTTATNCGCHPFLNGYNAFHAEPPPTAYAGERLEKGGAKAAAAVKATGAEWPQYMGGARRRNWTEATVRLPLKPLWKVRFADPTRSLADGLAADWRRDALYASHVSQPTAAEGVVLLSLIDQHQVAALVPDSGKTLWQITVDGRVDSPPTVHRGLALFGTRNGWVYAVNRDSGALVWRFLAAPAQRQLVASGQAESVWPVLGTVTIHQNLAWVLAGRDTQLDGGMLWYALEPVTGKVVKKGVLSAQGEWRQSVERGLNYNRVTLESPPDIASPFVATADGKQLLLCRCGVEVGTGKMLRAGYDFWMARSNFDAHFAGAASPQLAVPPLATCVLPRRWGLLNNGSDEATLNPVPFYGGVLAKIFAYDGNDFVALLGVVAHNRGAGKGSLARWRCDLIGKAVPKGKVEAAKTVWKADDYPIGSADFAAHAAVVKAGQQVLVARGRRLYAFAYSDGKQLAAVDLPAEVLYNGLAVVEGRVYLSCRDGTVVCLGR